MKCDYDLSRYIVAYQDNYQKALAEIKNGKKASHWMWYIFPQIQGLGRSSISKFYAIKNLDEAKEFFNNSYLGNNLIEISKSLLELETNNAREIFGRPDDIKLRSSMTLFARACENNEVFLAVLDKYFNGKQDHLTLKILNR